MQTPDIWRERMTADQRAIADIRRRLPRRIAVANTNELLALANTPTTLQLHTLRACELIARHIQHFEWLALAFVLAHHFVWRIHTWLLRHFGFLIVALVDLAATITVAHMPVVHASLPNANHTALVYHKYLQTCAPQLKAAWKRSIIPLALAVILEAVGISLHLPSERDVRFTIAVNIIHFFAWACFVYGNNGILIIDWSFVTNAYM